MSLFCLAHIRNVELSAPGSFIQRKLIYQPWWQGVIGLTVSSHWQCRLCETASIKSTAGARGSNHKSIATNTSRTNRSYDREAHERFSPAPTSMTTHSKFCRTQGCLNSLEEPTSVPCQLCIRRAQAQRISAMALFTSPAVPQPKQSLAPATRIDSSSNTLSSQVTNEAATAFITEDTGHKKHILVDRSATMVLKRKRSYDGVLKAHSRPRAVPSNLQTTLEPPTRFLCASNPSMAPSNMPMYSSACETQPTEALIHTPHTVVSDISEIPESLQFAGGIYPTAGDAGKGASIAASPLSGSSPTSIVQVDSNSPDVDEYRDHDNYMAQHSLNDREGESIEVLAGAEASGTVKPPYLTIKKDDTKGYHAGESKSVQVRNTLNM